MKVSLIIPCYNESKSIPKLLESCQRFWGDKLTANVNP